MFVIHIEHPVRDFAAWKKEGFDSDPLDRAGSGVKGYRVYRPVNSEKYAAVELVFETREEAEKMLERLKVMWGNVRDRFGWTEDPQAVVSEIVEER